MKKIIPFLALASVFAVAGCSSALSNETGKEITMNEVPFQNLESGYSISGDHIDTYYVDGSDVPYVSVKDYIEALDGFFDYSGGNIKFGTSSKDKSFYLKYQVGLSLYGYAEFFVNDDKIVVDNMDFLGYLPKSSSTVSYNSYLKLANSSRSSIAAVTFDLSSYGFDILYYNNKCLVPQNILNIFLGSTNYYNVFYNGDSYYGYYGEISSTETSWNTISNTSKAGIAESSTYREACVNQLFFTMDYFYGLKSEHEFTSFKNYISTSDLNKLYSTNSDTNHEAMKNIFMSQLDELHTRIDTRSIYATSPTSSAFSLADCGSFWNEYYSRRNTQTVLKAKNTSAESPVRYVDTMAIINFNSFVTGTNSNVYNDDGSFKEDAYKYDSFALFQYALDDIETHTGVDTILVDISLNGGGNLGALLRVCGFLTNENIGMHYYDTLSAEFTDYYYSIDSNKDGSYSDFDAYTEYNWVLLTGINTFSAANEFTCMVKNQNLGKVVGQKSGGGMCSILPVVLLDGQAICISSHSTLRYTVENSDGTTTYKSIEKGLDVDFEIPYEDFYTDSKLYSYIKSLY